MCHKYTTRRVSFSLQGYIATHRTGDSLTEDHFVFCNTRGKDYVPIYLYIMVSLSNLLVVLNSSVNFVVYCLVEESFRQELKNILHAVFNRTDRFLRKLSLRRARNVNAG